MNGAQVLTEDDPYIPTGSEPPRIGAVPVRFFGTYEFSWIESQRALAPFDVGFDDKSRKSKDATFTQAISEAQHFIVGSSAMRFWEPACK